MVDKELKYLLGMAWCTQEELERIEQYKEKIKMAQVPEPVKLSKTEDDYVDKALNAGSVGMLEIVHVLVLWRITRAQSIPDPDWIQRQFTILKIEVQKAAKAGESFVSPGTYIPKHGRAALKEEIKEDDKLP